VRALSGVTAGERPAAAFAVPAAAVGASATALWLRRRWLCSAAQLSWCLQRRALPLRSKCRMGSACNARHRQYACWFTASDQRPRPLSLPECCTCSPHSLHLPLPLQVSYGEATSAASAALGSNFSKASFVSTDKGEEVDLDDPDFWRKAIGLVAAAEEDSDSVSAVLAAVAPLSKPHERTLCCSEKRHAFARAC
jgi:hypothetical protein